MLNLTTKQLQYLVDLSITGSVRKAAQRSGVTQPTLSAQLKALEKALGVQLAERSATGATLTPMGRQIVEVAVGVLDGVKTMEDLAQKGPLSGVLKLGVKATLGPYLMPSVIKRLHSSYPDLRLFITEGAPLDLEAELAAGVHDLLLAQLPVTGADFHAERVFREPLYLAVAADDPLARKSYFQPSDLKGRDVLTLSPRFHLHEQVLRLCLENGANLLRDYEGTSLDALRQMVGMGMGVTLLPALYVESEVRAGDDVAAIPQKRTTLYRSIGVVSRGKSHRTAAVRVFTDMVREAAASRKAVTLEAS